MKTIPFHARLTESDLKVIHDSLVSSGNAGLASLFTRKEGLSPEEADYVSMAREYCDYDLKIDEEPLVSIGDDGAWVGAWVWVDGSQDELTVA
jgi:hypothetical protein